MRIRPITEQPTTADLSPEGSVSVCYRSNGRAYITNLSVTSNYFKGIFNDYERLISQVKVYGWFPGRGSQNLLQEFADTLISQDGENLIPSEQKRKIRIIDTEISKG